MSTIITTALIVMAVVQQPSDKVILTIALEASNQPIWAQANVAACIIERSLRRGKTVENICLQNNGRVWQFDCWNPKVRQKRRTARAINTARVAWTYGRFIRTRATNYHDDSVTPWWAKHMQYLYTVGNVLFYIE